MKRRVPPVDFSHAEPPSELRWFTPGPDGWTGEHFAAFLRARAAWRDTHADPLPTLPARERHFMYLNKQGVPAALISAENAAPNTLPPASRSKDS